ncbi:site-2 protease family protein [Patescibacteria group bacterium]|nr:site-2 protease family protein [Patescibacteria group bacterium]
MIFDLLFGNPIFGILWIIALVLSLTVHEFSHALVGHLRGDDTAERMGRLTLNPLAHLDVAGTIALLILGVGWAKPVPFDPRRLADPFRDGALIAFAGPLANILFAAVAGLTFRALSSAGIMPVDSLLPPFLGILVFVNLLLCFFNFIPVHPLDGAKIADLVLWRLKAFKTLELLTRYGPNLLLVLILISLVTPLNIFIIVQLPAFLGCSAFIGQSCVPYLAG